MLCFQSFGQILQILTSIKAHLIVSVYIFGAAVDGQTALESPNFLTPFVKRLVVFLQKVGITTQIAFLKNMIPSPDISISMWCDVGCPYIGRKFDDNWRLPNPTGESDELFKDVIHRIEEKILKLKDIFSQ